MVHLDEEDASSAAVGVCYRDGEPATPAESVPDSGEQDFTVAFAHSSPTERSPGPHDTSLWSAAREAARAFVGFLEAEGPRGLEI